MMELIDYPFTQQCTYTGQKLGWYKCNECGQNELFYSKMVVHLAVAHGIRPVSKERIELQEKKNGNL